MGLLDILSPEKRRDRATRKAIGRLTNRYRQGPERMAAAETLRQIGTEGAIYGLLRRFTLVASNSVVDEEEKQQVYEMVVGFGDRAVPVVRRFIENEDQISWPLKALSALVPPEEVVRILGETLARIGPEYVRNPEKKLHIVQHLAGYDLPGVVDSLLPFLRDHDETVRFQVLGTLASHDDPRLCGPLFDILVNEEEESLRIKVRAAEILAERGWSAGDRAREVGPCLPKGFGLDREGRVVRRP